MLKNYFLIAWRNMVRHRLYAAINVLGLALGMTVCILIFLWVKDEKSVDDLGPAGKDLYIVYESYTGDGTTGGTYSTPMHFEKNMPVAYIDGIRNSVPGIERLAFY